MTSGASDAGSTPPDEFAGPEHTRARRRKGLAFGAICGVATLFGLAVLAVLMVDVMRDGLPVLNGSFLTSYGSSNPEDAGVWAALWGTVWVLGLTALIAFPLAVGAAIYLEEYAPKGRITSIIQTNIANLAGVPSIVYGLLGLALFVRAMRLERSVIAGALTLAILVLPVIIIAAQEALRSVPRSLREAAYGLGATRWQVVRSVVLPAGIPGILTGTILSLSRAVGETAPLIVVGAVASIRYTPDSLRSAFTVLPIQVYDWVTRPQEEFLARAAAAILVLLGILLSMNATAIIVRNRYRRDGA